MVRSRDPAFIPIMTIPYLLFLLIFDRKNSEDIFSVSLWTFGIILFRFFKLEITGLILVTIGTVCIFCLDRDYENGRYSGIKKRTNPLLLKYFDVLVSPFKKHETLCSIIWLFLTIFWTMTLIFIIFLLSTSITHLILGSIISIAIFLVLYKFYRK